MFRIVFWDVLPYKMIVDRRFRGAYCLHHQGGWRQYAPVKRRYTIILHGSTSQKTILNITALVLEFILSMFGSRGSSVSVVSDYGLDYRAIGV
jgi:hypothetical protein